MSTALGHDKRKHPKPGTTSDDPMVEFYLAKQQFMDQGKEYTLPISVNGYDFMAVFGRTNRLPKSVVAVLKNSKTAVSRHTGGMSTPHAVDKATGGQGREQSQVMAGESQAVYVNDYEIVGEKEL